MINDWFDFDYRHSNLNLNGAHWNFTRLIFNKKEKKTIYFFHRRQLRRRRHLPSTWNITHMQTEFDSYVCESRANSTFYVRCGSAHTHASIAAVLFTFHCRHTVCRVLNLSLYWIRFPSIYYLHLSLRIPNHTKKLTWTTPALESPFASVNCTFAVLRCANPADSWIGRVWARIRAVYSWQSQAPRYHRQRKQSNKIWEWIARSRIRCEWECELNLIHNALRGTVWRPRSHSSSQILNSDDDVMMIYVSQFI